MKEKLSYTLGSVGLIIWYIISIVYSFAPLLVLDIGYFVSFLLILAMNLLPIGGELLRMGLYIWATIVVLGRPLNIIYIIFLICAAVYFFTTVLPFLKALFGKRQ